MKINVLRAAFFTPMPEGDWGLPLLLWGPPGVAKTSAIKQLGNKYGLHVERVAPGARGEGAFGVTPIPSMAGTESILTYPPPDWVTKLANGGIVFADEINTAPPALQPALLDLVQERVIGTYKFNNRVRVIGAANPTGQAAGGWEIAAAQANRMGHLIWEGPDVDAWRLYILSIGQKLKEEHESAEKEEKRVLALWDAAFATSCGLATAFLRRRPELLHKMPVDGDPAQSRAWASPRTWEYAARARASAEINSLDANAKDELVSAFIGDGPAGEWATFIEEADLPDPVALLDGKTKFTHNPSRLDRTVAVLDACAALITPKHAEKREERVKKLWKIIEAVSEEAKDVVLPAVQSMVLAGLTGTNRAMMAKLQGIAAEGILPIGMKP